MDDTEKAIDGSRKRASETLDRAMAIETKVIEQNDAMADESQDADRRKRSADRAAKGREALDRMEREQRHLDNGEPL